MISVSILMACRNEGRHIAAAVGSLLAQDLTGMDCEFVIADGCSDDGTREMLDDFADRNPRLRVISNDGRIVSKGLNRAIAVSRGEIIVRMDAHTEYAPDYVRSCVRTLLTTEADNVGGPARTKAEGLIQRAIATAYHSPFACGGARFHNTAYEGYVDTVTYGCWRRSSFDKYGLFDESLVRNQDDEHNLRISRRGGKIWQSPSIISWYRPRASFRSLFRQYFQYGFWKVKVIRKHRIPASPRHLIPGAFVSSLVISALIVLSAWALNWPVALITGLLLIGCVAGAYGVAAVAASIFAPKMHGSDVVPLLPAVFAIYHISYGAGFIGGLVRFALTRDDHGSASRLATDLSH